jgi:hypothetical protein
MSNFSDFIGGGGSASFPTIFLHNSQTWVPPQDGNIMIHVIGAGGSGCSTTSTTQLQSGAAGGYCRKNSLAVTTSGSFTVVVGAGGTPTFGATGAGAAGGNTTVAGTGLSSTLTATGGAGGALSSGTYTTGGVGSNGDFNSNGGRGGYRKGGGAVGLTGTGADGTAGPNYTYTACGGWCDILGDFYSSSLGQISGGIGGQGMTKQQYFDSDGLINAEPLAGGGGLYSNYNNSAAGGNASIGGGGGWKFANGSSFMSYSGRGGEGCVVIQYIP